MSMYSKLPGAEIAYGLCVAILGCGGEGAIPAVPPERTEISCDEGTVLIEDTCQPAPTPPAWRCSPGELLLPSGDCQPAGVPPEACGQGFAPDGLGGCDAILPDKPCPPGKMAIPGETACRDVAPCGEGDYGDIPIEPENTQFVNAAYAGDDSNGSKAKPWKTIQEAIDASQDGGMVAVAAGSYAESIVIERPVRLWGRCPKLVEVDGGGLDGTVRILRPSASGAELHTLGISGTTSGITVRGANSVTFDRVRAHDLLEGAHVMNASDIHVDGALIEYIDGRGFDIDDSDVEMTRSILRDFGQEDLGVGAYITGHGAGTARLRMARGIVEGASDEAILNIDAELQLDSILVRGAHPDVKASDMHIGIYSYASSETGATPTSVRSSVIERMKDVGIVVLDHVDFDLESTTIRHIETGNDVYSYGVYLGRGDDTDTDSTLRTSIQSSLIEDVTGDGLLVFGGDADIKATLIRDTHPIAQALGHGIAVVRSANMDAATRVTVAGSVVRDAHEAGIAISGAHAIIEGTLVQHTFPRGDGLFGRGIQIQSDQTIGSQIPTHAIIQGSLVEDSSELGIAILGTDATITETIVRGTQTNINDQFGNGIAVSRGSYNSAHARIAGSFIEDSEGVGVVSLGAEVELESSAVLCANGDIGPTDLNDGLTVYAASISGAPTVLCGCPAPDRTCEPVRTPPKALEPISLTW